MAEFCAFHRPGPDRGSKFDKPGDEKKVHKVFVTYSFKVVDMVKDQELKVNHERRTRP